MKMSQSQSILQISFLLVLFLMFLLFLAGSDKNVIFEEQTLCRNSLFKEENKSWSLWSAPMKSIYKRYKGQVQEFTRKKAWQLHNYVCTHLCMVFISQGFHQCIWGDSANIYIYLYIKIYVVEKVIVFLLYNSIFPSADMGETVSCA